MIQPIDEQLVPDAQEGFLEIIYDSEAYPGEDGVHHPYLFVALRRCHHCASMDQIDLEFCEFCGKRWYDFWGETYSECSKRFFEWLLFSEENRNAKAWAHNASRDHSLITKSFVRKTLKKNE